MLLASTRMLSQFFPVTFAENNYTHLITTIDLIILAITVSPC